MIRTLANGLRRMWPDSVSTRIAVVLMVALFALMALSMIGYVRDRAHVTLRLFTDSTVDRMAAVVALMEARPAAERASLLAALDSPTLNVALAHSRPAPRSGERAAERVIRGHLGAFDGRHLSISVLDHRRRDHGRRGFSRRWRRGGHFDGRGNDGGQPDLLPSRRKAVIGVGLHDGSWVVFTASTELTSLRWAAGMTAWFVLGGVAVALFATWVSRRVTAPVARFAAAADRIGRDVFTAEPLPETGSPDLRRAARTFNQMQERLRRLVEDRTQMLAAISHDMRTALTRLRLRIEAISEEADRRKAEDDLAQMQGMLEATLSFARDEAADEARRPIDLAALALTLCDDASDAGAAARYEGPDHLTLSCSPIAIRRALSNLIDNAITYGGEATVRLSEDEMAVHVVIADRGPSIPEAARETVFAPFYRLEASRSRETGGTGLGLSIARAAIRRHGGDITLADRDGGGLEARVSLPKPLAGSRRSRRS